MNVSHPTLAAVKAINAVVELVGAATAYDRILGRLCYIAPECVEAAALAELAQLDQQP